MSLRVLLAAISVCAAHPVLAQVVTDGDTIRLNGTIYRIWGIDAAETHQLCTDGWAAGKAATEYMINLVSGHTVTCESRGKDRYMRTIAICRADGRDLGADMVGAGMAWAFVRYSHDYAEQEASARLAGFGVHAHQCEKPWDWRAKEREKAREGAESGSQDVRGWQILLQKSAEWVGSETFVPARAAF